MGWAASCRTWRPGRGWVRAQCDRTLPPGGSAEQLALAMPTAAMVGWQVGAYEHAAPTSTKPADEHRVSESRGSCWLSTTAGLALTDGDFDAAIDFGTQADLEASELGVERSAADQGRTCAGATCPGDPLARPIERSPLSTPPSKDHRLPIAICLETASLIASAAGTASDTDLASLLATRRGFGSRRPEATAEGKRLSAAPSPRPALQAKGVSLPAAEAMRLAVSKQIAMGRRWSLPGRRRKRRALDRPRQRGRPGQVAPRKYGPDQRHLPLDA